MEDQLNGFFPLVSIVITSYNRATWIDWSVYRISDGSGLCQPGNSDL
jgi:hypothetical protein